ncbi:MFS transporter [Yinghuangia aomiensis]
MWMGVGSFLIPMQVTAIKGHPDPDALKNAVAVGAALAAIGNPIFGQISDRTRSRFGRRVPWIVICSLLGAGALMWQANAKSIGTLAITWGCVQFILNGFQAALTAVMPDRVPPAKYGIFSGLVGLGIPLGIVVSAYTIGGIDLHKLGIDKVIGGFDGKFQGENGYYLIAGILVACVLVFCLVTPDKPSVDMPVERFDFGKFLSNFWLNPRKHPDFAWAFLSPLRRRGRLLRRPHVQHVHPHGVREDQASDTPSIMGFLMVINAIATVIASIVVGKLVDRFGVIKPFVLGSGILAGLSLFIPMIWASVNGMTAFNVVNGFAFGMYMAVDMALITKVLAARRGRGQGHGPDQYRQRGLRRSPPCSSPRRSSRPGATTRCSPIAAVISLVGSVLIVFVKTVR